MFISRPSYCHHDRHHQHHSNWGDGFKLCQDLARTTSQIKLHTYYHINMIQYTSKNTFLLLWFQYPVGSTWPGWPVQKITSGCVHKQSDLRKSQVAFLQIPVFQHFPPAATSVSQPSNQPSISSNHPTIHPTNHQYHQNQPSTATFFSPCRKCSSGEP